MSPLFKTAFAVTLLISMGVGIGASFLPRVYAQTASNAATSCGLNAATDFLGDVLVAAVDAGLKAVEAIPVVGDVIGAVTDFVGGSEEAVKDKSVRFETKKINFKQCLKDIKDEALKVALAKFKKRLLDRMTDDIIAWISDGRDPKFITNFGSFLEEAAQSAVGDTARAIGLAELCSPFKARLPALLKPVPTFSQRASCTLDDIVNNIEGFYEDFAQGGPLAYVESLSPNNNYLGSLFATQDELRRQTAKKQEAAQLVASAGGGYKPITQCLEWTISGTDRDTQEYYEKKYIPGNNLNQRFENPAIPPTIYDFPEESQFLIGARIDCTNDRITLPPAGTQQFAGQAFSADTQYLANTNDLTPYLTAIFNAATNRVIKEGVKALRGDPARLQSESSTGRAPQPYVPPSPNACSSATIASLPESERAERERNCRYAGYGSEFTTSTDLSAQLRTELLAQIAETRAGVLAASTTLARVSALNLGLVATTTKLTECEASKLGGACVNSSSALGIANARTLQLESDRTSLAATLQSLAAIEASLANNATPSESSLTSLLTSVSTALNTIRTLQTRLNDLLVSLLTASAVTDEAFHACQSSSYSCSWTPTN